MTDIKKREKKRRVGLWIFLAILAVVGVLLGIWFIRNQRAGNQSLANLETVPYQKGTLSANIYGTGTVQSDQTAVLSWETSGIIGEVNVSLGESVEKGEVLVSLDPDSLSMDILQAQIDVINTQNALDDLYTNWESRLAQAKLDLIGAEEALEDLEDERKVMNYQRCTDERIEELEEELDRAEQIHQFNPSSTTLQAVNTAQANLNYCLADYTDREIAEAELKIVLAESRVAELEDLVDLLSDGPDPEQVLILETQLAMARNRLGKSRIEAPFAGVITVLPVHVGDIVQVGTRAVQIDDLSKLTLDVPISEIDIPQVQIGQPVDLVFDAYFDETYAGEVVEIALVGTAAQGVVEYMVQIQMVAGNEQIKPGMTAAVNIIVDEKEDIFLVPNEAIVSVDEKDFVYVQRDGTYKAVEVTLGGYSDFYSEVTKADIEEGELILLNPPADITGIQPFEPPNGGFGGSFGN